MEKMRNRTRSVRSAVARGAAMIWFSLACSAVSLAQTSAPAPGQAPASGGSQTSFPTMLLTFVPLIGIFWFFFIRPQRQQDKQRAAMLAKIDKNDHVVTIGGIHGVVVGLTDDVVTLRVDDKNDVRLKFTRKAISTVKGKDTAEPATLENKE